MRCDILTVSCIVVFGGIFISTSVFDSLLSLTNSLLKLRFRELCEKWPSMCGDLVDDNDVTLASDTISFTLLPTGYGLMIELFTASGIKDFLGRSEDELIYLCFLGQVFDVSAGRQHYGPSGAYHHFAGKDATRSFLTGDFTDSGLSSDVSDLPAKDLAELKSYLELYRTKYKFIGVMEGLYFDGDGRPTSLLKRLDAICRKELEAIKNKKEKFPSCDMQWTVEDGSTWWCTTNSGGQKREWVGVPRLYNEPGSSQARCVCVDQARLSDPHLKQVPGCSPNSVRCHVGKL